MEGLAKFFKSITMNGFETLGLYYSNYRGYVVSVDDPDSMNRIRIIIPSILGNQGASLWAYPKGFYSGKGHGCQLLPAVGDSVWVEFEYGKLSFPIWSHSYPYDTQVLPQFKDPKVSGYVFPTGHEILVDETNNTILIKHKDGNQIFLTENEIQLNDGQLGGLIKIEELVSRLNKLENWVQQFKPLFESHVHGGGVVNGLTTTITVPLTIQTPPTTVKEDLEDPKVIH